MIWLKNMVPTKVHHIWCNVLYLMVYIWYLHRIHTNCQINVNIYLISSFIYLFYLYRPYQTLNYFPTAVKVVALSVQFLPHFCIIFIYCWVCSCSGCTWHIFRWSLIKPPINRSTMLDPSSTLLLFLFIYPFSIDLETSQTLF